MTLFLGYTLALAHDTSQTKRLGIKALTLQIITRIWQASLAFSAEVVINKSQPGGRDYRSAPGPKFSALCLSITEGKVFKEEAQGQREEDKRITGPRAAPCSEGSVAGSGSFYRNSSDTFGGCRSRRLFTSHLLRESIIPLASCSGFSPCLLIYRNAFHFQAR